jgi:integrase
MAGTVRKRIRTNGKGEVRATWLADYFDQHGNRHNRTFPTKKAADLWLLTARTQVRDGVHTPDAASITVAEAGELWLQRSRREGLEPGSLRTYAQYAALCINPLIGAVKLSRLTRPMVEEVRDTLVQKFSVARARHTLNALRAILKHAQGRGLVAQNVALGVTIASRSRLIANVAAGRSIPSPAELATLVSAAGGWLRIMILLAAHTGLRQGELRGLKWDAIDFTAGTLTVRNRADQWGRDGLPKSKAGQRELDLATDVVSELRHWRLACGHPEMVFPGGAAGKPISQTRVIASFAALQRRAGIVAADGQAKYDFHELRHLFASAAIALRFTSKWLQTAIGHERIATTLDVYGHLFPDGDGRARMAAISSLISGKSG